MSKAKKLLIEWRFDMTFKEWLKDWLSFGRRLREGLQKLQSGDFENEYTRKCRRIQMLRQAAIDIISGSDENVYWRFEQIKYTNRRIKET